MNFLKNFSFSIFSILIVFFIFEIGSRVLAKTNFINIEEAKSPSRMGEGSYILGNYLMRPGIKNALSDVNSYGFSNPPIFEKANSYRIVAMGESTTYGYNASFENSYPRLLEKILNINFKKSVEVINAGLPGYATSDAINLLEKRILPLQPNLIIVQFSYNDFFNDAVSYSPNFFRLKLLNYHLSSSFFYKILKKILYRKNENIQSKGYDRYALKEEDVEKKRIMLKKNLEEILSIAKKNHIEVILAVPHLMKFDGIRYDNILYKDELFFACKQKFGKTCTRESFENIFKTKLINQFQVNRKKVASITAQFKKIIIDLSGKKDVALFFPPGVYRKTNTHPDDDNFFFADHYNGDPAGNNDLVHPNRSAFLIWAYSLAEIIAPKIANLADQHFFASDGNSENDVHDSFFLLGKYINRFENIDKISKNYYFPDYICSRALISREFEIADSCYKYLYKKLTDNHLDEYSKLVLANWAINKWMMKKKEETFALLQKGLKIDSYDAFLNYLMGSILLIQKETSLSLKYFKNCLSNNDRENIFHFNCLFGIAQASASSFKEWEKVVAYFISHPKMHGVKQYELKISFAFHMLSSVVKSDKEKKYLRESKRKRKFEKKGAVKIYAGGLLFKEDRFLIGRYNLFNKKTFSNNNREQTLFNPPVCYSEYDKYRFRLFYGM